MINVHLSTGTGTMKKSFLAISFFSDQKIVIDCKMNFFLTLSYLFKQRTNLRIRIRAKKFIDTVWYGSGPQKLKIGNIRLMHRRKMRHDQLKYRVLGFVRLPDLTCRISSRTINKVNMVRRTPVWNQFL
jgi:hypothetical protein